MDFIDIHCHLDSYDDEHVSHCVEHAKIAQVNTILVNGVNPLQNRRVLYLSEKYPEVKAALGLYPIDALKLTSKERDQEIAFIKKQAKNIVAIGEVGMDFKEDEKDHTLQEELFRKIISLSKELDKPLIIHSRKAEKEVISILREESAKKVIMHCFSGGMNLVDEIIAQGWFLSIPTNVTFSEHFQKVITKTPLTHLFCETDSPYLHPVKGKRDNEPGLVVESYKKIAEIKKISLDEVSRAIQSNYKKLFIL